MSVELETMQMDYSHMLGEKIKDRNTGELLGTLIGLTEDESDFYFVIYVKPGMVIQRSCAGGIKLA